MVAVSIYCGLIKYWVKQKHLLSLNFTNNELKEIKNYKIQIKMGNKAKDKNCGLKSEI